MGRCDEAKECFEKAIRINPGEAHAWNNLGALSVSRGCGQAAIEEFLQAIYHDPFLQSAHVNLTGLVGIDGYVSVLMTIGARLKCDMKLDRALAVFRAALTMSNTAATHGEIGHTLQLLRQNVEAAYHYSIAIRMQPDYAQCHANLGHVLREIGDLNGARSSFLNAVRIRPSAEDYTNLACLSKDLSAVVDAIQYFRLALQIKPEDENVYCNLLHSLLMVCDWSALDERNRWILEMTKRQLDSGTFPTVHPHHSFLYPLDNKLRLRIAAAHANLATTSAKAALTAIPNGRSYTFNHLVPRRGRLRVGYVSSDYLDHPTAHLMQSVPEFHKDGDIEVFCYSLAPDDGSVYRRKIASTAEHFVDVSGVANVSVSPYVPSSSAALLHVVRLYFQCLTTPRTIYSQGRHRGPYLSGWYSYLV